MKKIKIGQIGIGHNHGSEKMAALRNHPELFEVVGVVEDDPFWKKQRGGFAQYANLPWMSEEELLAVPGLEAVAVETDGFELVPTARRCAEHGLHIHLDKPGGESLQQFGELVEVCRTRKLALQLAYVYRYNPAIRFCLEAYRKGWLGEIFEIHAVMSRYDGDNPDYRRWLAQFQGGAMYIFAGYLIDVVCSLLGAPQRITPFLRQTRGDGLIDNGLAVMEYPIATATIRVAVEEVDGMKHRRLIVCGTKGSFELCPIEAPADRYFSDHQIVRLTLKEGNERFTAGTHSVDCGVLGGRYDAQLIEFARIVRGEIANPFSYDHEYMVQKALLEACAVREH